MQGLFRPDLNQTIALRSERYVPQPHPKAQDQVFCSEGRRAFVYQLRKKKDGRLYALKVFKKKYRDPSLLEAAQSLKQLEGYDGMQAASRSVISPSDKAARNWPDLQYAMLMPWLEGTTWFDVLVKAGRQGRPYDENTAIRLCKRFLEVMEGLENAGIAHTDIAAGNVTVKITPVEDVQLLDLEEMYIPGAMPPRTQHPGTPGYSHPNADSSKTTWCPEGDRYAVAVMASEMLILADRGLARLASDEGFFGGHRKSQLGAERFKQARAWLESIESDFVVLLDRAWNSDSLQACPRVAELSGTIALRQVPTPVSDDSKVPFHWGISADVAGKVPPPQSPQPKASTRPFVWDHSAGLPLPSAAPQQGGAPILPPAAATLKGVRGWLLVFALCLMILQPLLIVWWLVSFDTNSILRTEGIVQGGLNFYSGYALCRKRRANSVRITKYFLLLAFVSSIILGNAFRPVSDAAAALWLLNLSYAGLGWLYFEGSKRVAATYP